MTICEQTLSSYCFYVSALLIIHLTLSLRARCGLLTRRPTPSPQTINCVLGREQCKGFVSFFGDCRVFRSPPTNQVFPREFDENRSDMLSPNDVQLHMDTLEIYSRLLNQLNPSLQKLVSLGNSYIQAFYVLATTSEAYFKALARIGEQALGTKSSGSIGRILIQIAENQRKLSTEVEGVVKFHAEVLHDMDHHTQLDQGYISDSRGRYEIEVRRQADALERRRGEAQSECEYLVRRSYSDALQEEERRYRFLAEKHCDVGHAVAQVMNKTGGVSQQRLEVWREELNATRGREVSGGSSRAEHQVSRREEERSPYSEVQQLGRVPSRAPSPSSLQSRSNSLADLTGDGLLGFGGGSTGNGGRSGSGGGRRRTMKAVAAHQADPSKPTILGFQRGELVTVLVSQPRNGWLYGQAQNPSRQGWFPAAFVEAVDEPSKAPSSYRYVHFDNGNVTH
uniref:BAR/IMD domain containing adaptor protein 2 like 2a n=1 Tax=Gadus morhua TaxID=8049 RepID=A0A8C5ANS3_GADMO